MNFKYWMPFGITPLDVQIERYNRFWHNWYRDIGYFHTTHNKES